MTYGKPIVYTARNKLRYPNKLFESSNGIALNTLAE